MTRPPDMLRFLGGVVAKHEVGWTGEWPPPARMGVAVGRATGIRSVFEPNEANLRNLATAATVDVALYELRNASQLPDDFDGDHVFRGAEYVPETVA